MRAVIATYYKQATAVADYAIDWLSWLVEDTIATSSWSADSGLTVDSDTNTVSVAKVVVSGGTAGSSYELTNTITTTGGKTEIRVIKVVLVTAITAYATLSDVMALIPAGVVLTHDTSPNLNQMETWLVQGSRTVDGILATLSYSTIPATHADDVAILAAPVANMVALKTLFVYQQPEDITAATREVLGGWEAFLARLRTGDVSLNDQGQPSTASIVTMSREDGYS